jgi:hypothetical protein
MFRVELRIPAKGFKIILLLTGRFVALALAILAPILIDILNLHITMDPGGSTLRGFDSGCSTNLQVDPFDY